MRGAGADAGKVPVAQHNEKPFETELAEYLQAHGWLYSENSSGYDRQRALFPDDVLGWLEDTQPAEFARAVSAGSADGILDRLVKTLDKPLESGGGTLAVLRRGFTDAPVKFRMAQFKPATGLNPTTSADYGRMRLRVMRQVFYSKDNNKSIDLVLFVNGLSVTTITESNTLLPSSRCRVESWWAVQAIELVLPDPAEC